MSSAALTEELHEDRSGKHPATAKFGMIMFLISEAMLFAGLISAYIILRWTENGFPWQANHAWPPDAALPHLPVLLTSINTVFLIASSFTFHFGEVAVKKGKSGLAWILITVLLGATFVGVQCYEWYHLHHLGLWFNEGGVYGSSFFVITGFHGLHVIVGVLLIFWCFLRQAIHKSFTAERHIALENVALYWHFVDVVWIFLFTLLYWV